MATAPVKSQPLHNFSLPFLKWGHKNQVNSNHRFRRPPDLAARHQQLSSATAAEEEDERRRQQQRHRRRAFFVRDSESEKRGVTVGGSRIARPGFSFSPCSSSSSKQPHRGKEQDDVGFDRDRSDVGAEEKERVSEEGRWGEECGVKPWNLRPRKVAKKAAAEIGTGSSKNGELQEPRIHSGENAQPKSMRLRGFADGQGSAEKRKFWIALSREEIEEDVYALTGAKPARRPKKRPRTVQKQVDNVFPGFYLVGASVDSYRVHEAP